MNEIVKSFQNANVRFVTDPTGKYAFGIVAADLAVVLDYFAADKVSKLVKDKWKGVTQIGGSSGTQYMSVIWEPGVYYVLNRSNKPNAELFQDFVCEEVLPSIRETGSYSANKDEPPTWAKQLLANQEALMDKLDKAEERLAVTENELNEQRLITGSINSKFPGMANTLEIDLANDVPDVTAYQFVELEELDYDLVHKLSRRAAQVQRRDTEKENLPKRRGRTKYKYSIIKTIYNQLNN